MYNVTIFFKTNKKLIFAQTVREHQISSLVDKAQMYSNKYNGEVCIFIQHEGHILEVAPQVSVAAIETEMAAQIAKQGNYPSVIEFCNTGD